MSFTYNKQREKRKFFFMISEALKYFKAELCLLLLQLSILFVSFYKLFLYPKNYVLSNTYDGFKNYLTYHSYIQQKDFSLIYQQMNYPFGDFITFTDNTPLLSIPYKTVSSIFQLLKGFDIVFYNYFCLFSIAFTSLVLYRLFNKIGIKTQFIVFTFSLILPWLSPQLLRFSPGHLNLSLSWIIPLAILFLYDYYEKSNDKNHFPLRFLFIWLTFTLTILFIHVYYVAIIGVFAGMFSILWVVFSYYRKKSFRTRQPFYLLLITFICTVLSLLLLTALDSKSGLRLVHAEGYGFEDWKLVFRSLYNFPEYIPLYREIRTFIPGVSYESLMYLGITPIVLMCFFILTIRKSLPQLLSKQHEALYLLLISGLVCLSIGLGEKVKIIGSTFTNFLNPFYYLHFFTDRIEQFRCISRFGWVFFWVLNICVVYYLDILWRKKRWRVFVLLLLLLSVYETYYSVSHMKSMSYRNNLSSKVINEVSKPLFSKVQGIDYQAILPIPFYHVGCEDYNYTIDPEDDFFIYTNQMSLGLNLPNMGSKMSRTPVVEAKSLMSLFYSKIGMSDYLLERMKFNKKVLVIYDKHFYENLNDKLTRRNIPDSVIIRGENFVRNLNKIHSDVRYDYYEWQP